MTSSSGSTVDCGEIAKRHAEDLGGKRLNEAVMARLSPTSRTLERVTHYNLSAHIREMAATMNSLKDSHVFRTFWAQTAQRVQGTQEEEEEGRGPRLDVEVACLTLFRICLAKFRNLYADLKAGELTFGEVHAIFNVFVDKYEDLTSDLHIMRALDPSDPGGWIQERVGQIREYHHLHRSARAAKVILEVKETLGLTGDFSLLDFVLRIVSYWPGTPGCEECVCVCGGGESQRPSSSVW